MNVRQPHTPTAREIETSFLTNLLCLGLLVLLLKAAVTNHLQKGREFAKALDFLTGNGPGGLSDSRQNRTHIHGHHLDILFGLGLVTTALSNLNKCQHEYKNMKVSQNGE